MTRQAILSTKTGSYTNTVQLSVMPKGVEHHEHRDQRAPQFGRVQLSVMPKGVEHRSYSFSQFACSRCNYQ